MKNSCLKSFASGLVALASVLCTERALATDVSGTLSSDTVWSAPGSPYVVTGSVMVSEGVKLTVEATSDLREWKPVQTLKGSAKSTRYTPNLQTHVPLRYFRIKTKN